jgi:hypothetical protein
LVKFVTSKNGFWKQLAQQSENPDSNISKSLKFIQNPPKSTNPSTGENFKISQKLKKQKSLKKLRLQMSKKKILIFPKHFWNILGFSMQRRRHQNR